MSSTAASFSSEFFQIQELADGVFGVIGPQDGLCHSNAGIIDLGDQTLVIDTLTLPSYGKDLAAASRALTGRDPSWIAFTHYHADHWLGNQAFPRQTPLIATERMMPDIEAWMRDYQESIDDQAGFAKQVEDFTAAVESEADLAAKRGMEINLGRYQALLTELGGIELIGPNMLFSKSLRLTGTKRCVELIEVERAHTNSDVYVKLPDEDILFMGDLGFFDTVPFLLFADPIRWIDVLKEFETLSDTSFVPGHGIVAGTEKVALARECIEAVVTVVQAAIDADEEITVALSERLPEPFKGWALGRGHMAAIYGRVAESLNAE